MFFKLSVQKFSLGFIALLILLLAACAPGAPVPTLAEVAEFCVTRGLAKRRLPEQIEIVDALPRTPGGKVDKRALAAGRRLA